MKSFCQLNVLCLVHGNFIVNVCFYFSDCWTQMKTQWTIFGTLKFKHGSEAWGNKTKEFALRLRDEYNFFCFILPSLGAMLEF